MKLLRSEVPVGASGTLSFTSCESTILHGGIAAASLAEGKLHEKLLAADICGIIGSENLNFTHCKILLTRLKWTMSKRFDRPKFLF